jgi:hypothetical protein
MKRLIFCFDGTWNRLDARYSTNVVITAESIIPITSEAKPVSQFIYYDEGVGTERLEKILGGVFGVGILKNLGNAYRFLIFNYTAGDEIYVFGFSRGAYTARSFVGLLRNCGILSRSRAARVTEAIERYKKRDATTASSEDMNFFRRDNSPDVCVSEEEDEDGDGSLPAQIEASKPTARVSRDRAMRRAARAVFLSTAPLVGSPNVGIAKDRLRLACAEPGNQLSTFVEAIDELSQSATYLYEEAGRSPRSPPSTAWRMSGQKRCPITR